MAERLTLEGFTQVPRLTDLRLSPDGRRLVIGVEQISPDASRFAQSYWELPADGSEPPRRLTWSAEGESSAVFLADGSLVFTSARRDPTVKEDESEGKLWRLPAAGGEAEPLLAVPGGIRGVAAARSAPVLAVRAQLFPEAANLADDAAKAKRRKDGPTSAILFEQAPIRYWDHELGPRHSRLFLLEVAPGTRSEPADLTGEVGTALHEAEVAVSPDGASVATTWQRAAGRGFFEVDLVLLAGGERRVLGQGADFHSPAFSPDGRHLLALRGQRGDPEHAPDVSLWVFDVESGQGRDVTPGLDLWPAEPVWAADSSAIFFTADERGHRPLYRVAPESGEIVRLTREGTFSSPAPAPDGSAVFAVHSSYQQPPEVVRVEAGQVHPLPTPGLPLELPGEVSEITTPGPDGVQLRGWLVTPKGASAAAPVPLVLWIHGGPLGSWNGWHWRWCPHVLVERGYAVLLPDPALSTGYGRAFIQRGWGRWGDVVLRDLEAVLDAALTRPELDGGRLAAMGGSFGGYMANWIAGHSDRFRAIVTHASLWNFKQFHGTTDMPSAWARQFGDPDTAVALYKEMSPHSSQARIRTPMLVIHGQKDYRVPISEALRLWNDLVRHEVPARFLFFPDENHWILKPGNVQVWYQTVLAFLDEHLQGKPFRKPELL